MFELCQLYLTNLTSISQAVAVAISNPSNVSYAPVSLVWFPCPQESNFPITYVRLTNCNTFKGIYSPLFTKGKLAAWYVIHLIRVLLLYEPICCHPVVAHNRLELVYTIRPFQLHGIMVTHLKFLILPELETISNPDLTSNTIVSFCKLQLHSGFKLTPEI